MKPGLYVPIETAALAIKLLEAAACPDTDCDNAGTVTRENSDGFYDVNQCQWCAERAEVLADDE
jgi:hypothetical protein